MNLTVAGTARTLTDAPAADGLVIENLDASAAEPFQPGTCICWTEVATLAE
ncbi:MULTISPECIES: hypothetical protein [Streptomyces]|uniref:Uncharacterized protein n=2 Tax=Streptomyces TaxID=1883 RepID=A0ABU2RH23_9ACTN|nr:MULTISPECIES: hypothetical protein [unclassified Streptomyces]MBK3594476.1 hypothetical protein [Streptomyces sp. MBT51]MDT0426779.1 hypothetical protein [Streptomyces sp. DSM 41770]